jgi:N6-L-threonylcarbamoyladenine synthase
MDLDDRQTAANVAASFQRVAVAHLVQRVGMAADRCKARGMAVPRLVVCGGVARNGYLRRELSRWADAAGMDAVFPAPELCTDNGIMVAWAGVERLVANDFTLPPLPDEVRGTRGPNRDEVQYHPRWPL